MKRTITILLIITLLVMSGVVVFATTNPTGEQTNKGTDIFDTTKVNSKSEVEDDEIDSSDIASGGLPEVTIDQASDWAERKGGDIISLLQRIVQPLSTIIFIACAFLTLVGAFGNSQLVGRGIFGMFVSVIMYAVVLYAPELMDFVLAWLKS